MTTPLQPTADLQRKIFASASACAQAQTRLDLDAARRSATKNMTAREEGTQLAGMDLELPLTRQVIQRMEIKLRGRWVKSRTIGFRVEAGWRWGSRFIGLSHEQETTLREGVEATVTIHVEPVPLGPPGTSDLQTNSTQTVP
jgi:hypothetical protein